MKRSILCFLKDSTALTDDRSVREGWQITVVPTREAAFEALAVGRFEMVVVDARGPEGLERNFLAEVADRCPSLARVLLFRPADKAAQARSSGLADQCLPQPCTAEALVAVAGRARLMHAWLANPALTRLWSRIRKLPSVPTIYQRLVQALQSPDTDLEDVGRIMSEDFVMTAKLLQLVNSSFFGLKRPITKPADAVAHLGMAQTKTLVLLAHVFSNYVEDKSSGFSMDKLWQHSMGTASFARRIAQRQGGDAALADAAFTAGLLHDVGKLFYAVNCPQEYSELVAHAQATNLTYARAELHLLGTSHAELGACVLGTWGLPEEILEAVAFHHLPAQQSGDAFSPLTAVHVANALEHEMGAIAGAPVDWQIDPIYLSRVGCAEQMPVWKNLCATP